MGVMRCDRKGCESILCDLYSPIHGYLCSGCYKDLEHELNINQPEDIDDYISDFMSRSIDRPYDDVDHSGILKQIFSRGENDVID